MLNKKEVKMRIVKNSSNSFDKLGTAKIGGLTCNKKCSILGTDKEMGKPAINVLDILNKKKSN